MVRVRATKGNILLRYRDNVGPSKVPDGCVAAMAITTVYSTQKI